MSLNKILLIGNLGRDPEIKNLPSGKLVVTFTMATNRRYKMEGEVKEETEWFNVVAFGRLAEICSQYLQKGKSVFIEGHVRTRTWIDAQNMKHYRTEVLAQSLTMIGKRENGQPVQHAEEDAEAFDAETP